MDAHPDAVRVTARTHQGRKRLRDRLDPPPKGALLPDDFCLEPLRCREAVRDLRWSWGNRGHGRHGPTTRTGDLRCLAPISGVDQSAKGLGALARDVPTPPDYFTYPCAVRLAP